MFFEFPAVVLNGCFELREFSKGGAGLDMMGDRILPFFQPAVADKQAASIPMVDENHESPGFDSLNQVLADFEQLGDRPDGDAELFRGVTFSPVIPLRLTGASQNSVS